MSRRIVEFRHPQLPREVCDADRAGAPQLVEDAFAAGEAEGASARRHP